MLEVVAEASRGCAAQLTLSRYRVVAFQDRVGVLNAGGGDRLEQRDLLGPQRIEKLLDTRHRCAWLELVKERVVARAAAPDGVCFLALEFEDGGKLGSEQLEAVLGARLAPRHPRAARALGELLDEPCRHELGAVGHAARFAHHGAVYAARVKVTCLELREQVDHAVVRDARMQQGVNGRQLLTTATGGASWHVSVLVPGEKVGGRCQVTKYSGLNLEALE